MRVKGLTESQLVHAILAVNEMHGSQIEPNYVRRKGNYLLFTLRLLSRWNGHKRNGNDVFRRWTNDNWGKTKSGVRYNSAVCFHGHWNVYREIFRVNPDAVIVTAFARYEGLFDLERKAPAIGERNIGSMMYPLSLSNACDC